jgi:NDP-sugar pyrophosphorylase family protein
MLPALGKPLVVRIMDRLYRAGIHEYTLIVGPDEGEAAAYLNSHWMPDVNIEVMPRTDKDTLLSLLKRIAQAHKEPFVLCSYNCFTHNRFLQTLMKQHEEFPRAMLLATASNTLSDAQQHQYAVMDGQIVTTIADTPPVDQHPLILTDIAACGHDVVDYLCSAPDQLSSSASDWRLMDVAQHYIESGRTTATAEAAWLLQIETDRDLLTLNRHLLDEGVDASILSELPYTVQVIPPVRIDPQVSVGQGATIGPYVYLERGCTVGHEVTLRDTIIMAHANVPASKVVVNTIISTRGPLP